MWEIMAEYGHIFGLLRGPEAPKMCSAMFFKTKEAMDMSIMVDLRQGYTYDQQSTLSAQWQSG